MYYQQPRVSFLYLILPHNCRLIVTRLWGEKRILYKNSSGCFGLSFASVFMSCLQLASGVEVIQSVLDTLAHGLLTLTDPHARVKELLVGLLLALWVANGALQVGLLVLHKVTDTGQVGVLRVGVDIHLDHTVANGLLVLVLRRARASVEDEEDGLVGLDAQLFLDVGLVLLEEFGVQTDVSGLVDTVYVTETGGDGVVRRDGSQGVADGQDVLGLSVQGVVVNVLVVDTILFTTGDTDFLLHCQ